MLCVTALCHRMNPDPAAIVREFARIAQPGAIVAIMEPGGKRLWRSHDDVTHTGRRFSVGELKDMAQAAGLEVIKATGAYSFLVPPAWLMGIIERGKAKSDVGPQPVRPRRCIGRACLARAQIPEEVQHALRPVCHRHRPPPALTDSGQLLGIEHQADGLDSVAANLEDHHHFRLVVTSEHQPRLAVDLVVGDQRIRRHSAGDVAQQSTDAVEPDDGAASSMQVAAPIADQHDIVTEHATKVVDLTERAGREKRVQQIVAAGSSGLEQLTFLAHVATRTRRDLSARLLAAVHHRGDGGVRLGEHVGQQKHRSLDRRQPLQDGEEADGQRLGQLGGQAPGRRQ